MSSLGAATSGVDPQTGSYLSAEQRVAMFKGATGRSGFSGRSGGDGTTGKGSGNPSVQPQSAIVVANKMTTVVQKLQTSYQATTNTVASQAVQNKQTIQNLSRIVAANRQAELADEKAETKQLRLDKEAKRRADRESLIEGLSNAAAGLAGGLKKATDAVTRPLGGLLDRLLSAFGSLAAAWVLDNLPTILDWANDFWDGLTEFRDNFDKKLTDVRGVGSILSLGLKKISPFLSRVAKRVGQIGKDIAKKSVKLIKKIFNKLKTFVVDVATGLARKLRELWKGARNAFRRPPSADPSATRPPSTDPNAPKLSPADANARVNAEINGQQSGMQDGKGKPVVRKGPKWFQKLQDGWNNLRKGTGDMLSAGWNKMTSLGGSIKDSFASMGDAANKPVGPKEKKALGDLVTAAVEEAPISDVAKKGLLSKVLRRINSITKGFPGLGFAIDFLLNKAGANAMPTMENIARSLGSSLLGLGGASGGAYVGGTLGATLGSVVPVLGTVVGGAIGAALGGILGGMVAGSVGDAVGATAYEKFTGERATDSGAIGARTLINLGRDLTGSSMEGFEDGGASIFDGETPQVKLPSASSFEGGSTPEGLYNPDMKTSTVDYSQVELPPIDTRVATQEQDNTANGAESMADQVPDILSYNPETSIYRELSAYEYTLGG